MGNKPAKEENEEIFLKIVPPLDRAYVRWLARDLERTHRFTPRNPPAVKPPDHYIEYMRLNGWLELDLDDPDLAHLLKAVHSPDNKLNEFPTTFVSELTESEDPDECVKHSDEDQELEQLISGEICFKLEGVVTFFGRVAILIDQNTQAFHMFITALLQLLDRSGLLYGELARFVLRLLGIRTKPKKVQPLLMMVYETDLCH
ncbi:Peroxisomal membrane protein 13 [Camellia lanceoleosa]|uniref:Peroxisomal membrane protein 13 n=1 Tax=Camellia lanceoleosa TaxID=1840588 RepID=A0ACC0G9S9_9ERIC|nr:Peroxisomal membrane protein 13 [Camellia lanceoleosa]